ncbi:SDR family NAD(P)-dependent oxidoreductase [Bailinhaonella thermotolerans]|uniref:SDR family NAD(P)-dependent oxidoreductase n=1 Tax=Bailinhaonella thermotolerans TaxID=1070861 RepID=A0A3A4A107_9ACTN|nr:SDR family NAD(P)-dependent oxidoreductase [Bailinhaonella thermotolerans]RJL21734.1 SDR family NAD(P)-dependent oxidoreductase [Bailinhaonella thermotolerans]
MQGKTCIVTGATSGIGKEMAREFVRRGARVVIVCRNPDKGGKTLAEIGGGEMVVADLSVLSETRAAAHRILAEHDRIDVLMNNAGVHTRAAETSREGFDLMVATNHLSPFLFTDLLLPLVRRAAGRVVATASEAHRWADRLDLDRFAEPSGYGPLGATRVYGRSKLMNILTTEELGRRLAGTGATANSFCPGAVATALFPDPLLLRLASLAARTPLVRTPEEGARMGVRLATDPKLAHVTGRFFTSTPAARLLPRAGGRGDERLARALWSRTAALVGL